jgi:hypothetical protein
MDTLSRQGYNFQGLSFLLKTFQVTLEPLTPPPVENVIVQVEEPEYVWSDDQLKELFCNSKEEFLFPGV